MYIIYIDISQYNTGWPITDSHYEQLVVFCTENKMFFMDKSFSFGEVGLITSPKEEVKHEQYVFPANNVLPEQFVTKNIFKKIKLALNWLRLSCVPASLYALIPHLKFIAIRCDWDKPSSV